MKFESGAFVECSQNESWGVGQVFKLEGSHTWIFFENFGKKKFVSSKMLKRVPPGSHLLEDIHELNWHSAHHNVYVVELIDAVLNNTRFMRTNPGYRQGTSCYYVGMTGLEPEERFENHKAGYKSNYYAHRYGIRLVPELYENFNPMPYELAQIMEEHLADLLRADGCAVWQH